MKHFIQCVIVFFLFSAIKSKAQENYLMNRNQTINLSEGVFFDDGGQNHNVSNIANVTTFNGTNGILELYFTDFNIPYDAVLKIYDGTSTNGTLLGSFRSQDKPWNFKAKSITIEYIPSSSNAVGRGWRGVLKTSNIVKNPTIQSAPESDCPQAIPLCSNNTAIVSASQYVDLGSINDDSGNCYSGTGSGGSVWYTFTPQSTGPLDFLIIPSGSTDYDFVLWDVTNGCSSKTQVLCNYSATHGNTGAASGGASASEGPGGNLLNTRPTVTVGRQYAICINFFGGSNDGYTLQFQNEASSVAITDNIPPTITYVTGNGCTNTTVLDVYFSEWINCSTLQIGDFTMPGHTFGMLNNFCNGGKTNHVQISVSPALTAVAGTPTPYTLSVLNTGAGTSMNDMCGNPMNVNYVITLGETPTANAGPDKYNCKSPGTFGIGYNYSSVTLNGSGGAAGSIYNWSDGSTGQSPSVAPTQTTNYTLTVTQGACTATDVVTVFVENKPVVNLGPDVLMCSGLPLSMSASGGGTYQWQVQTGTVFILGTPTFGNIGGATSSTYSTIPTQYASTGSTYYQVNVTSPNGACTASDQIKVTFGAGSFGILSSKPFLCQGESTTLSLPTGMNAYSWSTGTSANTPLTVSPSSTTSYTATSTTAGCTGTAVITVPVRPLPVVVASATPSAICIGNTATLSATPTGSNVTITENFESANSFTFVNGANNKWYWGTAAFAAGTKGIYIGTAATNNNYDIGNLFTPKTATNHAYKDYTISSYCTSDLSFKWKCNGQAGQAELTVWLVPNTFVPTAGTAITAGAGNILLGGPYFGQTTYQSVTYNLNPYVGQTARIVFQWVNTGAAALGGPTVANPAASIDDVVFNESLTYSYSWSSTPSGLGATTQSLTVTPAVPSAYSVTITRCDGCTSSAAVPLTVLPAAAALTVSPTSTICPGQTTTLTANGGTTYTWSPSTSLSSVNGSSVIANPTLTTIYTVSTTACGGSITSNTVQVVVNGSPPNIGAINGSTLICPNQTGVTYSVTNVANTNYTWSVPPGATITSTPTNSNAITVNFGAAAGTVSVSAVNACGTSTASLVVGINPPITLTITPNNTSICAGSTTTLTASGATNYTWSPATSLSSSTGTIVIASPTVNTVYTIIGSTGTCTGSATASITINPSLSLTITPNNSSICAGGSQTLTATGATNYTWSPAASLNTSNGANVVASPSVGTTYTVIGSSGTCTGSATATITMGAAPTLTVTSNTPTVCPGASALLDANGATSYTWFPSATLSSANGSNVTASPLGNTTYTVLGSTGTCTSVATISVGIGACVSSSCNIALIKSTLTAAGNIELLGMNNSCSLYFINPQFMTGPQAQAYAQSFGANLISVQSAAENADLVQALSNQGFSSNVIWIGFSDAISEGNFVWYDGSPISYTNWAAGEPNNAGGNENCTQIYPDGGWNDLNCSGYNSLSVIEVNICPQVTVTTPTIHCPGTNVTLNASTLLGSPGYTYTWVQSGTETFTNTSTPGNTDQITVTSLSANTFTVFSEDRYSCPQFAIATLSVNPLPTVTVNSSTICEGQQTATLTANGASTYSWIPGTGLNTTTGSVVTGTPSTSQNYTVIGTDLNGCVSATNTAITVNLLPTISVSPNVTICPTQSATLTTNGTTSYTWSPSASLSSANGSVVVATPSVPTTYTVQGSSGGCVGTNTVSVNISGNGFPPNVYIVQKNSLCDTSVLNWLNVTSVTPSLAQGNLPNGITFNATHSGGGMSTTPSMFSGATFPASYSVPIAATTIRNDIAGTFNFCFSQPVINPQIAFASIGQAVLPITITTGVPYQVLWTGINMTYVNPTTLIGAEGFTIIRFPGTHSCISFDYSDNENYINLAFGVMDTECQNQPICPGDPIELIGNGASTYSWNNGATTSTIAPTPITTTTYSIIGLSADGCPNTATTTVVVHPSPTVTVNNSTICVGQQSATLTANGASTYTWSAGLSATSGSVVTGTPASTQNYTVTGTDINGCLADTTSTITVNPLPTITVNSASICIGQQTATLTANGATSYSWTPSADLSASTGSLVTGTPTLTQSYSITGTDANGCVNNTTSTITVNSLPIISVNSSTICVGQQTATLTANGATSYSWIPTTNLSSSTGSVVTGTPSATENYTVDGIDANGCVNSTVTAITVNPLPTVTVNSSTICVGQQTATLTANGADTYTWSAGMSSLTGSVVTGNPIATQNYTVTGEDLNGCFTATTTVINVNPLPVLVTSPTSTVCPLSANTLTINGANTYTWSPNIFLNTNTASSVTCTPSVTTTYTIDATSTDGCTNNTTLSIVVNNTVVVTASATTPTICPLGNTSLIASGASSYTWTPSLNLSSANGGTVTSTTPSTETYTVIGSTSTCTNSAQVVVTVTTNPVVNIVSSPSVICSGSSSILTAIGANTYTWSPSANLNAATGTTVNANPNTTTTYSVIGSSALGCIGTSTTILTIIPTPTIATFANPTTICSGKTSTLSAFGATNYTWSPSATLTSVNGNTTEASPILTTTYTVIGTNGAAPFLCTSSNTIKVNAIPNPTVIAGANQIICEGSNALLYAIGADTYTWSPSIGVMNINDSTTNVIPPNSGVFIYTITGTSSNNCTGSNTLQVTVNPLPTVYAGEDTTINIDNTVTLFGTGSNYVQLGFVSASDGTPLSCNYCPTVTVNPQNNTCYTLEAISSFGCKNSDVVCVTVTKDWNVYIPNAFTPNGDILNEVFIPVGYAISEIKLSIFDRWGHEIFKSHDDVIGWDGTNKGKLCEQGVYVYLAEITAMSGETIRKVGHVTLIGRVK